MAIESLASRPDLVPEFLALPSQLYSNDRRWIPADDRLLRVELTKTICADGRRADSAHFVAQIRGRIAARVSAFANETLHDDDGERVGSLGYFDAEYDRSLIADLIAHARDWLKATHGISRAWGPLNRDIWHGYRCMTEGHDAEPFVGEPYNFAYYPELLEYSGGQPRFRWNSYECADRSGVLASFQRGEAQRAGLLELGYRLVALDCAQLSAELQKLHSLVSESFQHFPAYTPISSGDFCRLFASLAPALAPGGAWFLHDPSGACCGFAVALIDVGPALRATRAGAPSSHQTLAPQAPPRALFHLIGATPAVAARCPGVGRALVTQVLGGLLEQGLDRYVAALMCRGNSSRGLRRGVARDRREYALYEWRS